MKKNESALALIAITIIAITFLHYYTSLNNMVLHEFYRRLYYFPIIVAAFRYGLPGGIITPIVVSLLYAPFVVLYIGVINIDIINQFLEIILFLTVGSITGILVEKQKRQQYLLQVQLQKIKDLENYTNSILESIAEGVIAVDSMLNITSINGYASEMLDYSSFRRITDINGFEVLKRQIEDVINGKGSIKGIETSAGLNNLNVRISVYKLVGIRDKGAVLIIENIEEVKALEEQVRRSDRLSAIGELSSGIAHEIRNPLGIIKTVSQTLLSETTDSDIKVILDVILEEVDRANKVIEELLDFARNRKFIFEKYSMNRLIDEVIRLTDKYLKNHRVKLELNIGELEEMSMDISRIKQVFINIIFNAVQAMPDGGILTINAMLKDGYIKISFMDTGIGIDKKHIDKIFNPFYTTKARGVGLGLSLAHKIVEEHKGSINVNSEVDKGTEISINFPVQEE